MATVLDFGILTNFSGVFIFLLIFLGVWALFIKIDFFNMGEAGRRIYSIMAFAIAFLVILSPGAVELFAFAIPWFAILLFIAFFMLFFSMMFNPDLDTGWLINQGVVYGFLITFVVIIMLFAFAAVFGQTLLETQPGVENGGTSEFSSDGLPADSFVPEDEVPPSELEGQVGVSNAASGSTDRNIGEEIILTLFHPNILGMLFVLVLAAVTMLLIAK